MNSLLLVLGSVFVVLAGLVHVVIFRLESLVWSTPTTWKRFGVKTQQDADTTRPMAYNQGFYNLFLAVGAVLGVILLFVPGMQQAGLAIALFAAGSMVAAATVLVLSNPRLARAAATQGTLPLIGVVLLLLAQL